MNYPKILKVLFELNNEVNQAILENKLKHDNLNFIELIYNKYNKLYINLFKEMFKMIKAAKINKTKSKSSNDEVLVAINGLTSAVNSLTEKVVNLEGKVDNLEKRIVNLEVKVDNLEKRIVNLEVKVDNLEKRIVNLEVKVDNLEQKVDRIEAKFDVGFDNLKDHFGIDFLKKKKKSK